jgi:phage baseplate assembly protein W
MSALGVALPLELSSIDGFVMIKDIKKLVTQNLKMLILTVPGERVMNPAFGVGVKRFLFSHTGMNIESSIELEIREQVAIYLPSIRINEILFGSSVEEYERGILRIEIHYSLPAIGQSDLLQITI